MPALAELLTTEVKLVQSFIDCLSTEQEALKVGDVEALTAVNAQKTALAEQLNRLEDDRNALLQQSGLTADRQGVSSWLSKHPNDRAAAQAWDQLMKLAGKARELNNLNGQLIAIRLQATNQALATLTQQTQRSTLYGPNGQTTLRTGSRIIDAA